MKKLLTNVACGIGFFACTMVVLTVNVKAYIDPSVATYMIQAIAGVVIAIGAVAGVYIRKTKKKINDKLGIDENRNKEVESDEIVVNNNDGQQES